MPHSSESEGRERGSSTVSIPRRPVCPDAQECRRRWIVDRAAETADCAHCYQTHSRADLARMLEAGA